MMQLAGSVLYYLTDIIYKNGNNCTGLCFKLYIKMSQVMFLSIQPSVGGLRVLHLGFPDLFRTPPKVFKMPPVAIVPREGLVAR